MSTGRKLARNLMRDVVGIDIPWTKPEEHHRMKLVNLRNGDDRKHDEENEVTKNEVASKHSKLSNLAKKFTTRLGN